MAQPPDLEARVAALEARVRRSEHGLVEMQNGFTEMRGRLDVAAAGQQQIVSLLNTLIDQDEDQ